MLHTLGPATWSASAGRSAAVFPIERFRGKDMLFAPGGLGLAPLRSLINQVLDERGNIGRVIILYGARDPVGTALHGRARAMGEARATWRCTSPSTAATRTGRATSGVITTLFPKIEVYPRNTVAVTVGPPVMYRFVLMELLGKGLTEGNIWMSLERRMKCGVGKCGHCQINHLYTCQSGPVVHLRRDQAP